MNISSNALAHVHYYRYYYVVELPCRGCGAQGAKHAVYSRSGHLGLPMAAAGPAT